LFATSHVKPGLSHTVSMSKTGVAAHKKCVI
jgi:hypothetical protein